MKQRISELWTESSKIIHNRFRLEVPECPQEIITHSDSHNTERFGGFIDTSGVLRLEQQTCKGVIPLRGVIFRESLYAVLPDLICWEAKRDIAAEYARQNLSKEEMLLWEQAWKRIPTIRVRANLQYTSFKMMEWMISLAGDSELDSLVHEFLSMAKYGKQLEFEEYVDYLTIRTHEIEVGLDHTEVKIIDILLENPNASNKEIGRSLGFSDSWVSAKINRLMKRHILRAFVSTPFSRIGIRSFHVLLAGPPQDEPWHYLTGCPFLYNLQYILNGPWQVLARLAVPDNIHSIRALDEMESILSDLGISVDIIETKSAALSNSFYHYNVASSQWEIPWTAMLGWGKRIDDESLHDIIPRIDTPAKTTDAYLDDIDIRILSNVNHRITSSRALRKALGIGLNPLTRHLRKLRYEGLIRKTWALHNIGLIERVAIRCSERRTAGLIDTWMREFPKVFLHYSDYRDLLAIAELPTGASSKMMRTIRSLGWPVSISLLGGSVWGQWSFPLHLWDVETQRWDAPMDAIDIWLDSLAQQEIPVSHAQNDSKIAVRLRRSGV